MSARTYTDDEGNKIILMGDWDAMTISWYKKDDLAPFSEVKLRGAESDRVLKWMKGDR